MSAEETKVIEIRLTPFQEGEVAHGLSIDEDNVRNGEEDASVWGEIVGTGKRPTLRIWDPDSAVWRITSSRDILWDNAGATDGREAATLHAQGRSLDGLAAKIVEAIGGPDELSEDTRHLLVY